MAQVIEHLPSNSKALRAIPGTTKKKKEKKERKRKTHANFMTFE
jgi:hypothetical protein